MRSPYRKNTKHEKIIQVLRSDMRWTIQIVQYSVGEQWAPPHIYPTLPLEMDVHTARQTSVALGQAVNDAETMRRFIGKPSQE